MKKILFTILLTFLLVFNASIVFATDLQEAVTGDMTKVGETGYGQNIGMNLPIAVGRIINAIMAVTGIVMVYLIIRGGWEYMMAQGDTKKTEAGKNYIRDGVIGLIIIFMAYGLTYVIIQRLARATGVQTY